MTESKPKVITIKSPSIVLVRATFKVVVCKSGLLLRKEDSTVVNLDLAR